MGIFHIFKILQMVQKLRKTSQIYLSLTLFFPMFPFDPSENIRKPLGFRISPSGRRLGEPPLPLPNQC